MPVISAPVSMSACSGCSKTGESVAIIVSSISLVQSLPSLRVEWSTSRMIVGDVSVCTISPSAPAANLHLPRPAGSRSDGVPVKPMRF